MPNKYNLKKLPPNPPKAGIPGASAPPATGGTGPVRTPPRRGPISAPPRPPMETKPSPPQPRGSWEDPNWNKKPTTPPKWPVGSTTPQIPVGRGGRERPLPGRGGTMPSKPGKPNLGGDRVWKDPSTAPVWRQPPGGNKPVPIPPPKGKRPNPVEGGKPRPGKKPGVGTDWEKIKAKYNDGGRTKPPKFEKKPLYGDKIPKNLRDAYDKAKGGAGGRTRGVPDRPPIRTKPSKPKPEPMAKRRKGGMKGN